MGVGQGAEHLGLFKTDTRSFTYTTLIPLFVFDLINFIFTLIRTWNVRGAQGRGGGGGWGFHWKRPVTGSHQTWQSELTRIIPPQGLDTWIAVAFISQRTFSLHFYIISPLASFDLLGHGWRLLRMNLAVL